jgi:hypothetical protein
MSSFNQLFYSYGHVYPTVSFASSNSDIAINSTTKTFTAQGIGTAKTTRYVVVGVTGTGVSGFSISTLTVQGISATKAVETVGATRGFASIWIVAVPTGTTGDVVITWSGTVVRAGIGVWAVYDIASATPTATNSGSVASGSGASNSVNVSANGVNISIAYDNGDNTQPPIPTWTGVTQRYNLNVAGDSNTGGDFTEGSAGETPRSISVAWTLSTTSRESIAGASWL